MCTCFPESKSGLSTGLYLPSFLSVFVDVNLEIREIKSVY